MFNWYTSYEVEKQRREAERAFADEERLLHSGRSRQASRWQQALGRQRLTGLLAWLGGYLVQWGDAVTQYGYRMQSRHERFSSPKLEGAGKPHAC